MAYYLLNEKITKRDIMIFLETETAADYLEHILSLEVLEHCRRQYQNDTRKTSSLLGIFHYTHLYFLASRWRTPEETYEYFKESLLCHSIEWPPTCMEVFSPEEAKEALLFFIEIYLRNLPLTRLLCLPHFKLNLKTKNETNGVALATKSGSKNVTQ